MPFGADSYALGFVAGAVSTLSPCVLPLLPVVVGSAVATHRLGAVALAGGLALAFFAVGLFVATIGFAIGFDGDALRLVGAGLLAAVGVVLLSGSLQAALAAAGSRVGSQLHIRAAAFEPTGLGGQFLLGGLLGVVWSPCVGPTLGAASLLAAQGRALPQVGLVMALFAVGAAMPLVAVGLMSRALLARWRQRLLAAGKAGKIALGGVMLVLALAVATGADRQAETVLTGLAPAWLTDLTTRF